MIVSMPPLRIWWPSLNAFEIDHGAMGMPRGTTTEVQTHAYPLTSAPNGIDEVHIEHWSASTTSFTDVGDTEIGPSDGTINDKRAAYISWLAKNPTLAVQYAHRRIRRFTNTDGKDSSGNSVVPDASTKGDEIIHVKQNGTLYATGLRRAVTGGSRILWKQSADLTGGPVYNFSVSAQAPSLTAQAFIDNNSSDPGYLSTVKHAYWEDIADFPGGPGTGGANVPLD